MVFWCLVGLSKGNDDRYLEESEPAGSNTFFDMRRVVIKRS